MVRLNRWNHLVRGRTVEEGIWRLTPDHELQYRRLDAERKILLAGPLVQAEPLALSFRVEQESLGEDVVGRQFSLRGCWAADSENRLTFQVDRGQGRRDFLTLEGGWEVGPGQEILYRLEERGSQRVRLLRFQGYWDLDDRKRLVYLLERSSDSGFRFSGAFQTHSVLPKRGELRYQLGAEVQGRRRGPAVTLFGKWKLSDRWGIRFEVPYSQGRVRGIDFGASYSINAQDQVTCQLRTRQGKPLGVEVVFTREFLKGQGEAFLRLRKSLEDTAVEGGLRLRW